VTIAIRPLRTNHLNVVLQDFDRSIEHFRRLFDAEFIVDIPRPEMHAGLVAIGRVIFELFVPHEYLLNARYGPHYIGVEYRADMDLVRAAVASHGIRIVRDIGLALHTHPEDCFGIAFEFYDGEFHDRHWDALGGTLKSEAFWRDEHPLGLTGLKGYSIAVADSVAAGAFLRSFLGAVPLYREARPALGASAEGLRVADAIVELLAPTSDGPIRRHLDRFGNGIRSTVFGVRDLDQARRYFAARGIEIESDTAPDIITIAPAANLGILFEFAA
jgi:hypothetical protein